MEWRRRFRLQTVLALIAILALLILAATFAVGSHLVAAHVEQRFDRMAVESGVALWRKTLAAERQRMRAEITAVTRHHALVDALMAGDAVDGQIAPLFNRMQAAGVADRLIVFDREGRRRYDSRRGADEPLPLAEATLQDGLFHDGLHHTPGKGSFIGLSISLFRGGELVGVVVLMKDLTTSALDGLAMVGRAEAVLLGPDGPLWWTDPRGMPVLPEGLGDQPAAVRFRDGERHGQAVRIPLHAFGDGELIGNVVLVEDITASVTAQRRIQWATHGAAVAALVVIGVALYFWLGRVVRPLRQAVWTLDDVGRGRFATEIRPDSRILEVATLQEAAQRMVDRLQRLLEIEDNVRLALRDSLTQLPNRWLLLERLEHAIETAGRSGRRAALMLFDLDNFKSLNDTRGHSVGDRLLIEVGRRLSAPLRNHDTVARLGGDEFVVLLEELKPDAERAAADARQVAHKLMNELREPFVIDGAEQMITVSVGITVFPQGGDTVEELLKQGDFAMYQAKSQGRNTLRFYDPALQRRLQEHVEIEHRLRRALREERLRIHLQPQVDAEGRIFGAEALMRCPQKDGSMLSPVAFIPVAEQTGQVVPIGRLALRQACETLHRWSGQPQLRELTIAVNVSPYHLQQPHFLDDVHGILEETGADPARLQIELTESVIADYSEPFISNLSGLRDLGIRLALDDFGTGYSSLGYLKRLPVDRLKIDRTFVQDVDTNAEDAGIVSTIIAIAHGLGLSVLAEGVETEAQRDFLIAHGCTRFQGFLFHRPMPVADFEALLLE